MLMFRWLVIGSLLWPLSINAATGPEYLEAEEDKDPLSAGFQRFKLPFVVERQTLLHLRSYYLHDARDLTDTRIIINYQTEL